jgi:hypothetical protein
LKFFLFFVCTDFFNLKKKKKNVRIHKKWNGSVIWSSDFSWSNRSFCRSGREVLLVTGTVFSVIVCNSDSFSCSPSSFVLRLLCLTEQNSYSFYLSEAWWIVRNWLSSLSVFDSLTIAAASFRWLQWVTYDLLFPSDVIYVHLRWINL